MSDILEKKNLNSLYGKMLSEQIADKVFILYEEYGRSIARKNYTLEDLNI